RRERSVDAPPPRPRRPPRRGRPGPPRPGRGAVPPLRGDERLDGPALRRLQRHRARTAGRLPAPHHRRWTKRHRRTGRRLRQPPPPIAPWVAGRALCRGHAEVPVVALRTRTRNRLATTPSQVAERYPAAQPV